MRKLFTLYMKNGTIRIIRGFSILPKSCKRQSEGNNRVVTVHKDPFLAPNLVQTYAMCPNILVSLSNEFVFGIA